MWMLLANIIHQKKVCRGYSIIQTCFELYGLTPQWEGPLKQWLWLIIETQCHPEQWTCWILMSSVDWYICSIMLPPQSVHIWHCDQWPIASVIRRGLHRDGCVHLHTPGCPLEPPEGDWTCSMCCVSSLCSVWEVMHISTQLHGSTLHHHHFVLGTFPCLSLSTPHQVIKAQRTLKGYLYF